MPLITIDVRADDITHGVGCDSSACMVSRAVQRHLTPDTDIGTGYTNIILKQYYPAKTYPGTPRPPLVENSLTLMPPEWVDVQIPKDDPHAIALGLAGQRVRRRLEDIIRQFDGWKDHLISPTVCPFVAKPVPFRFQLDVPTQYLNENAILVARVQNAPTIEEKKTILQGFAPTAALQLKVTMKHEDLEEITQPNDPDNSSSDLKAPKHTELFPS